VRHLLAAIAVAAMAATLAACGTGGKVSASADPQNGKTLFQQKCAGCHVLQAAGATGTIGPNLDASFAQARSEGFSESAIANIVHDQIRFPGQYSTAQNNPNYLTANMPAKLVTGRDADDVAAFVAANAGLQGYSQSQAISGTNGQQIFKQKCASCHTLQAAGATGTIGPNLDQLKPPLSVVQNQVIRGGGVMPAFQGVLTDAQIKAVAKYVSDNAGK
jgi:cbb3-type cytochrome c oxidase subunit III